MKNTIILGIANPESQQGKSTTSWLLANALSMASHQTAILDCDEINPIDGDPTVSSYQNARIPLPFQIYNRESWDDTHLDPLDYLLYDSSRQPPSWVNNLIEKSAHGVIIPIRNGRGFKKGIDYARTLHQRNIPVHFVLNNLTSNQADMMPGLCLAYNADMTVMPELDGIHDMTTAGKLPQMLEHGNLMLDASGHLYNDVMSWTESFNTGDEHELKVVNG